MLNFGNDERTFECNKKFKPKSTFDPQKQGRYYRNISNLMRREKLLDIDIIKDNPENVSNEERGALYF